MKIEVTTSAGEYSSFRLKIEDAPMILMTILNSEGIFREHSIDRVRVNTKALTTTENELFKKWWRIFYRQLTSVGDVSLAGAYARYFVSIFTPAFSGAYQMRFEQLLMLREKLINYLRVRSDSEFDEQLSYVIIEFLDRLSDHFDCIRMRDTTDSRLLLFRDTENTDIFGRFYSHSYTASLNAVDLSIELSPLIRYDISEPDPKSVYFYVPHLLDDNLMLYMEYLQDMEYEVSNYLWPSAMRVTVTETGMVDSLIQKSTEIFRHTSTRIEIPDLCERTLAACNANCAV